MPPDALALYAAVILLLLAFFLSSPDLSPGRAGGSGSHPAAAIFATLARRWFLQRIDAELQARAVGIAMRDRGFAPCTSKACWPTSSISWPLSAACRVVKKRKPKF